MRNILKSRKAQITVFIIIGIILLFSSALIIYIKNKVTNTTPPPKVIQSVPDDMLGFQEYVDQCIYLTAKQGVEILGAHGGYIYPEDNGIVTIPNDPTAAGATGVSLLDTTVPYWSYMKSPNNCNGDCDFDTKKPSIRSMETQLSDYVNANIQNCLNNFESYTSKGFDVKEIESIKTRTTIGQTDVTFTVLWPLEVTLSKPKKIEYFSVTLPVNLRGACEMAEKIMTLQSNSTYFETNTLNLITYTQADYDNPRIPPMAQYSFKSGDVYSWSFTETKQTLESVFANWVPVMRVQHTLNDARYFYPDSMTQSIMDKMRINTYENETYYPYSVNFRYSAFWPIYLDITPRNGDMIRTKTTSAPIFSFLPGAPAINENNFQYDISYPVHVTITDPNSFNGEGYTFMFAFETNIRNNEALTKDFASLKVTNSLGSSFVCDEEQKKSGNITINTVDAATGKPLDGASVVFAFSDEGCQVGVTKAKPNSSASITERLPLGIGRLRASMPDYLTETLLYAVGPGKTGNVTIELYPVVKNNVTVVKYTVDKIRIVNNATVCQNRWTFNNIRKPIEKDETVSIIITRVKTPENPDEFFEAVDYNGSITNATHTIRLAPGKYEVTMITTLHKNLTIPEYRERVRTGLFSSRTITYPKTSIAPYMESNMQFNNETYYFDVKPEDLYKNNTVVEFKALAYDLESVPESCRRIKTDLSPSPNVTSLMVQKRSYLEPKIR